MKKHYETPPVSFTRELLIGLGESSFRKSYYPELQQRMAELERFRLLLDRAKDAIFLVELSTMRVIDINTTACQWINGTSDSTVMPSLASLFSLNFAECVTAGQTNHTIECFLYGHASALPVEVSVSYTTLQDIAYVIIVARNITERMKSDEQMQTIHEELHASYEELEALYGQISQTESVLRKKVDELEESEARYRLAIEGSNDGIWDWDIARNHWLISPHWYDILNINPEVYTAYTDYNEFMCSRIHPDDLLLRERAVSDHLSGKTPLYEAEYRFQLSPNKWLWIHAKGKALFDDAGQPLRMCGSFTDITQRKRQEQHIYELAYRDSLTGLYNRSSLYDNLEKIAADCKASDGHGALFLLDIDNFKLINDSWGHAVGDQLLIQIAEMLKNFQSAQTTVARLGGDEFALLIPAIPPNDLDSWANRILQIFNKPVSVSGTNLAVSCSIGIAAIVSATASALEVLRNADTALNQSKDAGKNAFCFYKPAMQQAVLQRIQLENDLRQALVANQFVMYYQPQTDLNSNRIVSFEALIRWVHPEKGLVPPMDFIPLAEETGLIIAIGEFALRSACKFGLQLKASSDHPVRIAVNISARQLMQADFVALVNRIITEENYPPELLELEITESILMKSFASTVDILNDFRLKGITISLDDFGSGYSSLTYLRQLPINTLKIDKNFIQDIVEDAITHSIVGTIIKLARDLNLAVVAEGIETPEQLAAVRALACSCAQGYFISRPLPSDQALALTARLSIG